MNRTLYSIGEVSKIKDVTIKALRYYHKMGIIEPVYVDLETGYRYYTAEQFIHIDIVKYCREVGVSIKELQELFRQQDTSKLMSFLKEKKSEVEQNIKKMETMMDNIDQLSLILKESKEILNQEDIRTTYFETRYMLVVPCQEQGDFKELIYYSHLRKLIETHKLKAEAYGMMYHLNDKGASQTEGVFALLEEPYNVEGYPIKELPAGDYLVLSYSKENEESQRQKLEKYLEKERIVKRSFIEIDLFTDFFNTQTYSCQLQMAIEK